VSIDYVQAGGERTERRFKETPGFRSQSAWAAGPVDYVMSADARWLISRFQSKLNPGVRV
jgi:hypothetical protein